MENAPRIDCSKHKSAPFPIWIDLRISSLFAHFLDNLHFGNFEMSKFELISDFSAEMCGFATTLQRQKCFNLRAFFCLSDGNTALIYACKSFLAESDASTLFRFWGDYGKHKCAAILAKRKDLDVNIKDRWHSKQFSVFKNGLIFVDIICDLKMDFATYFWTFPVIF